jgi:predicted membrane channel-forming protein YqfA (hemolysin III family)
METDRISDFIRLASNISLLVPLLIYISRVKYASRQIHLIGAIVILSCLSDLIGYILFKRSESNVLVFNGYYFMLFFLLSWFYYEILFQHRQGKIVWVGIAVYLLSFILITLFFQGLDEYQTLMWVITAIMMITYSIGYFFYSLSTVDPNRYLNYSFIWINVGIMIYFGMNLFLFTIGDYVLTQLDPLTSALIWSSHNVNNIIKNILFAIGIYFYQKKYINPDAFNENEKNGVSEYRKSRAAEEYH